MNQNNILTLQKLCLFCGSSSGNNPLYTAAADEMGHLLSSKKITAVYGGGSVGMMGRLADSILKHNGIIIGVIPEFLAIKELIHPGVKDMRVVSSMHERKALMNSLADGFIAMPGGLGTFEEMFEVLTWAQLSIHQKPIGILNTHQFFTPLLDFLKHTQQSGFISNRHLELFVVADTPAELLEKMQSHNFPQRQEKMLDHSVEHATRI